jgi:hypothetical protein
MELVTDQGLFINDGRRVVREAPITYSLPRHFVVADLDLQAPRQR